MAIVITTLGALSMVVGCISGNRPVGYKTAAGIPQHQPDGLCIMSVGIGMILIARGLRTEVAALAISGGIFHLLNHAAFKGLLFLNAGAIEYSVGTRDLREMGGLAKSMPVTSATSFAASLSISGIPPFNGFFSKLIIIVAAVMGHFYFLAAPGCSRQHYHPGFLHEVSALCLLQQGAREMKNRDQGGACTDAGEYDHPGCGLSAAQSACIAGHP